MKISFIVKAVILGFIISLISACGATTKNSDTSNDSADSGTNQEEAASVSIKFQDQKYEIVPVQMEVDSAYSRRVFHMEEPFDNFYYPLRQSYRWIADSGFAFRNKQGQYLTFDNECDYSTLCYFPFFIEKFNIYQWYDDDKKVGICTVFKNLCDSFNIPLNVFIWAKINSTTKNG